jgi:short-subunit dehydrogenase
MRKVMIVGATSAIAEATARIFAERHDRLYLVARNADLLSDVSADLKVRGAERVASEVLDLNQMDAHAPMIERASSALDGIDIVLVAHGVLPDQQACERSVALTLEQFQTNALSVISLATLLANRFEAEKQGCLAVISSVAGDRGRAKNYAYGTAKATVSVYLSGLRQRLFSSGVHVLTIKPGFVDTPMTRDYRKGPIWAKPEAVARGIVKAIDRRRQVVYLPGFWFWIMLVIRAMPDWLFVRVRV